MSLSRRIILAVQQTTSTAMHYCRCYYCTPPSISSHSHCHVLATVMMPSLASLKTIILVINRTTADPFPANRIVSHHKRTSRAMLESACPPRPPALHWHCPKKFSRCLSPQLTSHQQILPAPQPSTNDCQLLSCSCNAMHALDVWLCCVMGGDVYLTPFPAARILRQHSVRLSV